MSPEAPQRPKSEILGATIICWGLSDSGIEATRPRSCHGKAAHAEAIAMELRRMAAQTGDLRIDTEKDLNDQIRIGVAGAMGVNGVAFATVFKTAIAFDDQKGIPAIRPANEQIRRKTDGRCRDLSDRRVAVTAEKRDRPHSRVKKLRRARPAEAALRGKGDQLAASRTGERIIDGQFGSLWILRVRRNSLLNEAQPIVSEEEEDPDIAICPSQPRPSVPCADCRMR